MNRKFDIEHIRGLVDKFYQGETTPQEERVLAEFFMTADRAELPADMVADDDVFSSLAMMQPSPEDVQVPDDLAAKLEELTATDKLGRRLKSILLKCAGAAAAACVAWAVVINLQPKADEGLIAKDVPKPTTAVHEEVKEQPMPVVEEATTMPAPVAKPMIAMATKAEAIPEEVETTPEPEPDDGYVEITDPEEVRQIVEEIRGLLASNIAKSDEAMGKVSASIESYKKLTKNILQ